MVCRPNVWQPLPTVSMHQSTKKQFISNSNTDTQTYSTSWAEMMSDCRRERAKWWISVHREVQYLRSVSRISWAARVLSTAPQQLKLRQQEVLCTATIFSTVIIISNYIYIEFASNIWQIQYKPGIFCVRVMSPERHHWKPAVQAVAVTLRTPASPAGH